MAFKNIKVKQRIGKILYDQPCIHFDVEADFIIFKPTVGCTLKGKKRESFVLFSRCLSIKDANINKIVYNLFTCCYFYLTWFFSRKQLALTASFILLSVSVSTQSLKVAIMLRK